MTDENKEMTDHRLSALIDEAVSDSIFQNGEMNDINQDLFDRYNGKLYGDEEEGRSSVVSMDVADTVDSDMVALARIFLGAGDVVEIKPLNASPQAVQEAEEKNLYINWILDNVESSYKKQFDWLKEIVLQKCGFIEYGIREETKTETKKYFNINQEFLTNLTASIEAQDGVDNVKIVAVSDNDEETFDADVKITRTKQVYFIDNVANEDLIISRNAATKDEADIFGKHFRKSRGDLIAEGIVDEKTAMNLPVTGSSSETAGAKQDRFQQQGGENSDPGLQDAPNQIIEGIDVYVNVDYDGDGIPERRHVIKVGSEILLNEPHDHIPYAGTSAIQMPHNIIGKSRGELVLHHQRTNTVLTRTTLDNIYESALGRTYLNENTVDMDDFYSAFKTGVVRVDGDPGLAVMPEIIPYTGDKTLQIIQYQESKQSKTTGHQLTNQALSSDSLNEETATRFEGTRQEGAGKLELVARNIAGIAYTQLYDGLIWYASHYQNSPAEILVLGKPLTVNPNMWMFDHKVKAVVGTGAGDDEKTLETLSSILAIQSAEQQTGSILVDSAKKYNTLQRIIKAAGLHDVEQFFNDPSRPDQLLQQENELMKGQLEQAQQIIEQLSQQNPLAEAERVKNEGKQATDNKRLALGVADLEEKARQFNVSAEQKDTKERNDMTVDLAKLDIDTQRI